MTTELSIYLKFWLGWIQNQKEEEIDKYIHIGIVHRISVCRLTVNHERKLTSQSVELFVKMASDLAKKQAKTGPKNATPSNEEIVQGFQRLRAEQRQLANKLSELEMDLNEHK